MKSKLIASTFAAIFAITLTVVVLAWKFSKLPEEKNFPGTRWWAVSPYEWHALTKLDSNFAVAEVDRIDVPLLYSPLKIRSAMAGDPYFGALEQIRQWMIDELSHNESESWRQLLARDKVEAHPTFKAALAEGFGGASPDCSILKIERAFRLRELDAGYFEPAMSYLEGCKVEKGVLLMGRIDHALRVQESVHSQPAGPSAEVAVWVAQLKQVQSEVDPKSLLATTLARAVQQIETSK